MCPVSPQYQDIADRVACLLSSLNQADLGITDEEIDFAQSEEAKIPQELRRISCVVGEILEETELECDQVDQMVALFLAITPEKVKYAQDLENKAHLKKNQPRVTKRKSTRKKENGSKNYMDS